MIRLNVTAYPEHGCIEFEFVSKYAAGSIPCHELSQLVKTIEDLCGKGSFCLYQGKDEDNPKWVGYDKQNEMKGKFPTITYWQQGIKTDFIERTREEARKIWGNIPELQIGWLENQCKSYIEDIVQ